jgi:hypothetical protein
MLQPFSIFKRAFIPRLVELNKNFLVAQEYKRGLFNGKTSILLTDYDDPGLAKNHYDAVKDDKYAAIIYLTDERHYRKLIWMLSEHSPYVVYWSMVNNAEAFQQRVSRQYAEQIRKFIVQKTNWSIGRDKTIRPVMKVIFGQLYILIKYSGESIRAKFEDIENA